MKIKIIKEIKKEIEVDIIFPHYFKHDILVDHSNVVIFGKMIDNKKQITIKEDVSWGGVFKSYEIEKERFSSCYLANEYKSTEQEYKETKKRALDFLQTE